MKYFTSTYRLQFNRKFNFKDALPVADYLYSLGVEAIYASPIMQARYGSDHGYDVIDHSRLNSELGDEPAFLTLSDHADKLGLLWIQDVVPNHMAFDMKNLKLRDVLEKGRLSRWNNYFDINWDHPYDALKNKVLVPFLGKFYSECIRDGEIRLIFGEMGLTVKYWELELPVSVDQYETVLTRALSELENNLSPEDPDIERFLGMIYSLSDKPALPAADTGLSADSGKSDSPVMITQNTANSGHSPVGRDDVEYAPPLEHTRAFTGQAHEQIQQMARKKLFQLYQHNQVIREHIDSCTAYYNAPENREALDQLLSSQHYRLAFWKVAATELNYRRFFNINELISIRVESPEVLNDFLSLIDRYIRDNRFHGLRFDHIDGLYDPSAFLEAVHQRYPDIYTVVEKILEPEEKLPEEWPIHGTTGYDFTLRINSLFCLQSSEKTMTRTYSRFTGIRENFRSIYLSKKRLIIDRLMTGDIDNLAHRIKSLAAGHLDGRDLTLHGLRRALAEVMTQFSVYRTYTGDNAMSAEDLKRIHDALDESIRQLPDLEYELEWLRRLLAHRDKHPESEWVKVLDFIRRFQQYTGPLTAKGFEDTLYYVYNRMPPLNEVGGAPDKFGMSAEEFHDFIISRQKHWPFSMNTTATHDTKRGEDTRARMNVISEIPDTWARAIRRWSQLNRRFQVKGSDGRVIPDKNDEYFLYMTLAGSWPLEFILNNSRIPDSESLGRYTERIREYSLKAVREAKVHTAWIKPDEEYESGFLSFVEAILDYKKSPVFLDEFQDFVQNICMPGLSNSLGQTVVKIASPGIPDIYQGTELWDFSLVDPDNRRPVDYDMRLKMLQAITSDSSPADIEKMWNNPRQGHIKMYILHRLLHDRRQNPELYLQGLYRPLHAEGPASGKIISFERACPSLKEDDTMNTRRIAAIRLFTFNHETGGGIRPPCKNTSLMVPSQTVGSGNAGEAPNAGETLWKDLFTSQVHRPINGGIPFSELFRILPVALLTPVPPEE